MLLLPKSNEPALGPDEILTRFVTYTSELGLTLYPAQEEAILHIIDGKHVVLATPTGSGKSLVATALHFVAMSQHERSFYTCPIKALVNEKFFALCDAFGAENVGLMTGDASVNKDAPIICCTAEVLANLALREGSHIARYVVMDEFHYYADKERGVAWQLPLLTMPDTTFVLMSATLGDVSTIASSLAELSNREVAEVKHAERPVPLTFLYAETPLQETVQTLLEKDEAPVYLVNFAQRTAAERAQDLMSVNVCSREEKAAITQALQGFRFDTPFGKELGRFVRHGIGLHHAGLLPKYRLMVEKLAQQGLLKVISGTDTLGVGVNIPIRTVLFTQLCKYDGEKTAILSVRDFLQVAGRAGRKGFDNHGTVVAQAPEHVIENKKLAEKKNAGKKVVMQKAPTRGYVHWDKTTFDKLQERPPEPLESRFSVTHGLILSTLQSAKDDTDNGYKKLVDIIGRSHATPGQRRFQRRHARTLTRALLGAEVVMRQARMQSTPARLVVNPLLQKDFSLNNTLALYLLDSLQKLDRQSETYALDVLSLVEAILESPDIILFAQLDKLKGQKVAEMKAAGIEYDERMAELEKLEWPKPNREFVYATFNAFAEKHPWVGQENIRPKSIARELYEQCMAFHEYVREYQLMRAEGVLLRYLSSAYKTLVQSVPESFRDEQVTDIIEYLHALLVHTDSSLIDEWERLRDPDAPVVTRPDAPLTPRKKDLSRDPEGLRARVRAELHQLLRALAQRDYETAQSIIASPNDWSPERFATELAPYWAEHASIDTSPNARRKAFTTVSELSPKRFSVRQIIVDPASNNDWMLDCEIDLTNPPEDDALPIINLLRIGT